MSAFSVRRAGLENVDAWVALRHQLWPELEIEQHRTEAEASLNQPQTLVAFLCRDAEGKPVGLAEASVRSDYVNGCETSPVAFLEGIIVAPAARRRGVAALLVAAVGDWARSKGLTELASDAALDNIASHRMHAALGFEETERVVYFRRSL
jgi:aminoglycoside 6'-N-acetyltransferase I